MAQKCNPYPGINPHLNSALQQKSRWKGFHSLHLADIARAIEEILPEAYYTANEDSLQIGAVDPETKKVVSKWDAIADVTIARTGTAGKEAMSAPGASAPTLLLSVSEAVEEEDYVGSIMIYQQPGHPVTRIELLSPTNKPPHAGYHAKYFPKREATLKSGLRLVEIDYLHESQPIDERIPSYRDRAKKAYPYYVAVSDPRPTYAEGIMQVYGFGVLEPLPMIDVPLDGTDTIRVNFGAIYNQTFLSSRLFREMLSDPAEEPLNFKAYSAEDQALIRQQMADIAAQRV